MIKGRSGHDIILQYEQHHLTEGVPHSHMRLQNSESDCH